MRVAARRRPPRPELLFQARHRVQSHSHPCEFGERRYRSFWIANRRERERSPEHSEQQRLQLRGTNEGRLSELQSGGLELQKRESMPFLRSDVLTDCSGELRAAIDLRCIQEATNLFR